MTNTTNISKLIEDGESEKLEFKSSFNAETIVTLSAFANTKGGSVLVGVNNNGEVIGIRSSSESFQSWINEIKSKTIPAIIPNVEIIEVMSKKVAKFTIGEFPVKPVAVKGRFYKRIQNSNHLLDIHEISMMHLQSLKTSWDSYTYANGNLDDIDFNKVDMFIERVNNGERFQMDNNGLEALRKLSLVKDLSPTNAAMILFSKRNLGFNVHVGRFKTPSYIIDDKMISGGLFEVVEETMRYIIGQIKIAFEITGEKVQRNEIFESVRL